MVADHQGSQHQGRMNFRIAPFAIRRVPVWVNFRHRPSRPAWKNLLRYRTPADTKRDCVSENRCFDQSRHAWHHAN